MSIVRDKDWFDAPYKILRRGRFWQVWHGDDKVSVSWTLDDATGFVRENLGREPELVAQFDNGMRYFR